MSDYVPHRGGVVEPPFTPDSRSEWDVWKSVHEADAPATVRHDKPTLSEDAVLAVLRRAFVVEAETDWYPDSWPDGPFVVPVDDAALSIDATTLTRGAESLLAKRSMSLHEAITTAAEIYGRTYGINLLGHTLGGSNPFSSIRDFFGLLNGYPRCDSIAAHVLAPCVRRLIPRALGPAWYFRYQAHLERSKRGRTQLVPFGFPQAKSFRAPADYGWRALETWLLKVFLFDKADGRSDRQQAALVDYAVAQMTRFSRRAGDDGPLAMQFFDLCGPLRHYLFWYATSPLADINDRRRCRNLLGRLQHAAVPRLPPRAPRLLDDGYRDHYSNLLSATKKAWSETRGAQRRSVRKERLEKYIEPLGFLRLAASGQYAASEDDAKAFARVHDHFWRDCGNLYSQEPADFAMRATLLIGTFVELTPAPESKGDYLARKGRAARELARSWRKYQMEPQAMKEAFARLGRSPAYCVQRLRLGSKTWEEPVFVP